MKQVVLCFFMLLASAGILRADPVTFEATVNSNNISLDEVIQLTLTFTGVNDNLDPVSLPVIDGFSAKYLGPSTSVSFVNVNGNSESHSERSFIYNLFPNKVGKFQVPPISATINGQTYSTKPIDIEVFQSSAQAQSQTSSQVTGQDQAPGNESIKDKVQLIATVDNTNVYQNEQIPLSIKLLINGVPIREIQYPQFDKQGFLVDDYDKPLQGTQVLNGVSYDTAEFKTRVYPSRLGDLTLGPAQIQFNVLYKTSQASPFNQANNPFGGDIFSNFFDSYAVRPMTVTSQPIELHVAALPSDGRPADFSGAVGNSFDFQASVSPLKVKAGDPITLKMDVTGNGNYKNLQMPVFQASGFKTYSPQIKAKGDEKTLEEVIIPTSTDIKEVPALHFSYFDTSTSTYKTITQGPFSIQVSAPNPDQEFKAVGFSNLNTAPLITPTNQFSWRKIFKKIQEYLTVLLKSIWFWTGFGFLLLAAVSFFIWRRFQEKLENDPAFARRFKAVKEARQALAPAEKYISKGKTKELYALLSKTLCDYLANKWHYYSAALSVEEIITRLKKANLDTTHINQIKALLEQCDLVCFAGANRDAAQMRADLSLTQELINYLQQHLK